MFACLSSTTMESMCTTPEDTRWPFFDFNLYIYCFIPICLWFPLWHGLPCADADAHAGHGPLSPHPLQATEPSTTFPIIMRWFPIQIAYNIGNVVQTDKVVRTNGAPLQAHGPRWCALLRTRRHRATLGNAQRATSTQGTWVRCAPTPSQNSRSFSWQLLRQSTPMCSRSLVLVP